MPIKRIYLYAAGVLLFLLLVSILEKWTVARIKGAEGEKIVASLLRRLSRKKYTVFHNVMLRTSYGTSQIDHIVVSRYGVFVIETKNYKGWITGKERSDQWTQWLYGQKHSFQNPIRQNYGHIKALRQLLKDIAPIRYVPIVTFPGDCHLHVRTFSHVVRFRRVVPTIRKYREPVLEPEEVEEIVKRIREGNIDSLGTRKEHIKEVKVKKKEDARKAAHGICPRCGSPLVKKRGRYGVFYGCSDYPRCTYIQNKK